MVVRYVRINLKHTYRQIRRSLTVSLSTSTIKRILEPFDIRKWQCKKRPELSEEVAKNDMNGSNSERIGVWRNGHLLYSVMNQALKEARVSSANGPGEQLNKNDLPNLFKPMRKGMI